MLRPDFDPVLIQSLEPVSSAYGIITVDPVDPVPNQIEPELAEAGTQNEREITWENYLKNLSHTSYVGKITQMTAVFIRQVIWRTFFTWNL